MKFLKKIFDFIKDVLFIFLVTFIVMFVLMRVLGIKPMIVLSGSMEPIIKTGSIAFIDSNYEFEDVRVGDIVVFDNATDIDVVHRAIEKVENIDSVGNYGFITQGDNNDVADGLTVTKETFKGTSIMAIPYLGYAVSFLKDSEFRYVFYFIIIYLFFDAFLSIIADFVNSANEKKKKKEEEKEKELDEIIKEIDDKILKDSIIERNNARNKKKNNNDNDNDCNDNDTNNDNVDNNNKNESKNREQH